jgi:hypothetical protein
VSSAVHNPGRWDMHCHVSPCLIPRWGTAIDAARSAQTRGFAGMMLFAHHASTYREAALAEQAIPGIRVIGGVTLNRVCGGLISDCVRIHLASGVRLFSLPTFDALAHIRVLGAGRSLAREIVHGSVEQGISLLDGDVLHDAVLRVLDLLASHGAVLCSGHIGTEELAAVVPEVCARSLPFVINHPYFLAHPSPAFWESLPPAVYVQFAAVNDAHDKRLPPIGAVLEVVSRIGAHRCMLGSQASAPTDPLRRIDDFCLELVGAGVPAVDVETMASTTPRSFVGAFFPRLS